MELKLTNNIITNLIAHSHTVTISAPLASIKILDYEYVALLPLFETFERNKTQQDLTPNPTTSYRRIPSPQVWIPAGVETAIDGKIQLFGFWEACLLIVEETEIFDGTRKSALEFRQATSLTPWQFAQAWLESEGSCWRWFSPRRRLHDGTAMSGNSMVRMLVQVWKLKGTKVRDMGREVALERLKERYMFSDFEKLRLETLRSMAEVMLLGADRAGERQLCAALKVAATACSEHPQWKVCGCDTAIDIPIARQVEIKLSGFVSPWRKFVLENEDAGTDEFLQADEGRMAEQFVAAMDEDNMIDAMLAFQKECLENHRGLEAL